MEFGKIEDWSNAVDSANDLAIQDLPDLPAGSIFKDAGLRVWQRVSVVGGANGGRWAYWVSWKTKLGSPGIGPDRDFHAIADTLFNGDAFHFIGMLGVPYARVPGSEPSLAWVVIEPRMSAPPVSRVFEDKPSVRYEKSKDVFNVESQGTTKLP